MADHLDSLGMEAVTFALPEQVEAAAAGVADLEGIDQLPDADDVENIVMLGMGGSGIGADVMVAVAGPFMSVPIVVCKGYAPPSFVGPTTLCFAVSYSGDTEETLEAAATAAAGGARMVAVTRGGELGRLANGWGAPVIPLPDDIPMPRAGLGAVTVPPLVVLERVGLFPGATEWIALAVDQLRSRRDKIAADRAPVRELAHRVGRTIPLIYGGGHLGLVAATRWKNQINENAKAPAFFHTVPELMHNEICGWGQHGDVTRQVFTLVLLRHDHEHPQMMRRFELVREWTEEVVAGVEEIAAEGEGPLAQLLDLVFIGDVLSLELAFQEGVDPGPIPVLDAIKESLAAS